MGGGLSDELKQATFSIGLKGVKPDDVPKVEELAVSTLKEAASEGFEADAIEASLNTIEFSLREFNTGGFPRGLSVMLAVMPRWLYGRGSPADALRFEEPLAKLKARLDAGEKVFEELLERMIVKNQHVATVELVPDTALAKQQLEAEAAELAKVKATMSESEIMGVIESTKALKEAQLKEDSEEDLKSIPTDFAKLPGGGELLTHPLPTAGVVYADVLLGLKAVPLEDLPYVRFLSVLIDEVGTSDMNAVQMQRRIGARTGGISTAVIFEQPSGPGGTVADPYDVVSYFALRGKSTGEKASDLFELMHGLLADANLADGQAKAVELLKETQQSLESSFISSGNSYAGMRLAARNSLLGYIGEATQGVTYYHSVKEMLAQAQSDWPALLAKLESVRATMLSQKCVIINLTADEKVLTDVRPAVDAFIGKLPEDAALNPSAPAWKDAVTLLPREDEAFAITTQVNYVAAGARLFEAGESCPGDFYSVARFLSRGYLWDNVRVVGGAYGGGCALNSNSGGFAFSSYRDPNLQGTLDIYEKTIDVLDNLEITDEALEQAIVGAVGDLDSPMNARQKGSRALTHYLTGVTTEQRQQYRDAILGMTRASFAAFADRLRKANLGISTFASKDAVEAANAKRADDAQIKITQL